MPPEKLKVPFCPTNTDNGLAVFVVIETPGVVSIQTSWE